MGATLLLIPTPFSTVGWGKRLSLIANYGVVVNTDLIPFKFFDIVSLVDWTCDTVK